MQQRRIKQKKMDENFKKNAEETCRELKSWYIAARSYLYVNEKQEIAVIGIQAPYEERGGERGHDSIYILRSGGKLEKIVSEKFCHGRLWPTGISEDGTKVNYTRKSEEGNFQDLTKEI